MTTDASGTYSQSTIRRKSFYDEEQIDIKPSPELIPDEYEHSTSDSVLIHIFRTDDDSKPAEDLMKTVAAINNTISATKNLHYLDKKEEFFKDLESIRNEAVNKSALILFFIGFFEKDGTIFMTNEDDSNNGHVEIKCIWNKFSANNCPELKGKPKIYIFSTSQRPKGGTQLDAMGHRRLTFEKVYDFPAEADMLIIYHKVDEMSPVPNRYFIKQLCNNINEYSKKYDIIDLVSCFYDCKMSVPLVISTLTRKFYLTPNNERQHYLSIIENHDKLEERLTSIKLGIDKIQELQQKKKKFLNFSFKKKSEDKPKIVKKKETPIMEPPQSPRVSGTPSRRLSTTNAPTVGGTRIRSASHSETDSGAVKRKPIWRI
jgi:hypothetical protein